MNLAPQHLLTLQMQPIAGTVTSMHGTSMVDLLSPHCPSTTATVTDEGSARATKAPRLDELAQTFLIWSLREEVGEMHSTMTTIPRRSFCPTSAVNLLSDVAEIVDIAWTKRANIIKIAMSSVHSNLLSGYLSTLTRESIWHLFDGYRPPFRTFSNPQQIISCLNRMARSNVSSLA